VLTRENPIDVNALIRADNRLAAMLAAQRLGLLPACERVSAS
jgi:hypothetical protein